MTPLQPKRSGNVRDLCPVRHQSSVTCFKRNILSSSFMLLSCDYPNSLQDLHIQEDILPESSPNFTLSRYQAGAGNFSRTGWNNLFAAKFAIRRNPTIWIGPTWLLEVMQAAKYVQTKCTTFDFHTKFNTRGCSVVTSFNLDVALQRTNQMNQASFLRAQLVPLDMQPSSRTFAHRTRRSKSWSRWW